MHQLPLAGWAWELQSWKIQMHQFPLTWWANMLYLNITWRVQSLAELTLMFMDIGLFTWVKYWDVECKLQERISLGTGGNNLQLDMSHKVNINIARQALKWHLPIPLGCLQAVRRVKLANLDLTPQTSTGVFKWDWLKQWHQKQHWEQSCWQVHQHHLQGVCRILLTGLTMLARNSLSLASSV